MSLPGLQDDPNKEVDLAPVTRVDTVSSRILASLSHESFARTFQREKVLQRNREYNEYQQWKTSLVRTRVHTTHNVVTSLECCCERAPADPQLTSETSCCSDLFLIHVLTHSTDQHPTAMESASLQSPRFSLSKNDFVSTVVLRFTLN